jgi:broad specificity phosphatase PhoE
VTRLWLIRHGPTHARTLVGWTDLPADLGDAAALARLSAALPNAPVVSSDLIRARDTARRIAGSREVLPVEPRLREIHFGHWEGLSHNQAAAADPALTRAFWSGDETARAPGGESWRDLRARVDAAMDALLEPRPADLIVVAHFGVILSVIQRATGASAPETLAQTIEPLSLTTIRAGTDWRVETVNQHP